VYGAALRIEGQYEDVTRTLPDVPHVQVVSPGYFDAMAIPLTHGREFARSDRADSPPAVIVSASVARRFWPHEDPIGKRIGAPIANDPWWTIVGVAADVRQDSLSGTQEGTIYRPLSQATPADITLIARTSGAPEAVALAVTHAAGALEPSAPVTEVQTLQAIVSGSLARPRFTALLLGAFASLALLLAAVGVYAVIASLVAQRTREIGVRVALGATPAGVLRMVLGGGVRLAVVGAALGTVISLLAGRALAGLLYGVSPHDAVSLTLAPAALVIVAIVATWAPARAAAASDPNVALRAE
jgi:putative ABC transport system permease protein